MGIQDFGPQFDLAKFFHARDMARSLTYKLSSLIRPGMEEAEAHALYKKLCEEAGIEKQWHPPKIRFGPNTLKCFKELSDPYQLKEEDIFFIDIGPIVDGHEADYGETFQLGGLLEHQKIISATKKIFEEVSALWREQSFTGQDLYQQAQMRAQQLGYRLDPDSEGHRLGDFPHHLIHKGDLADCEEVVVPNAWILEIDLKPLSGTFGAFYEDILN